MALQLNNGTFVNLWDVFDDHGESAWATVLLPKARTEIATAIPPPCRDAE
jgi:hypothetical protein